MTASLVPELYVTDLEVSLRFYTKVLGFETRYLRPVDRFAYIARQGAELMLEEPIGRTWLLAPLERPFGRGINLQIAAEDVADLHDRLTVLDYGVELPLEYHTYDTGAGRIRVCQFVIADPDGYLLRFQQRLGVAP